MKLWAKHGCKCRLRHRDINFLNEEPSQRPIIATMGTVTIFGSKKNTDFWLFGENVAYLARHEKNCDTYAYVYDIIRIDSERNAKYVFHLVANKKRDLLQELASFALL